MKIQLMLLLPLIALFLGGCTGEPEPTQNGTKITVEVSQVTVTEDIETIITGTSVIINNTQNTTNQTQNQTNLTIPSYTYEPNATMFVFFINASYIEDRTAGASNDRQGEAILIKKGDADILIDAGNQETSTYLINYLRQKGVDDIDLLISTRARPENYGGMEAVLDNIPVEQFMWNGQDNNDAEYEALVQKATAKTKKVILATYLMNISMNGMNLLVINPKQPLLFSVDNDGIALKVTNKNFSLMTTGGIAYGAQTRIADSSDFSPKVTVLQIPNNGLGSATSQIDLFLVKTNPEIAIITGDYFDPFDERYSIYGKLDLKNIKYYTTFNSTATKVIRISTDGYTYSVQ